MLIKEVIVDEGLFDAVKAKQTTTTPTPLLAANQQQKAIMQSRKRKLMNLVATKQQKDRQNALRKVTANDKLLAFIAAQQL